MSKSYSTMRMGIDHNQRVPLAAQMVTDEGKAVESGYQVGPWGRETAKRIGSIPDGSGEAGQIYPNRKKYTVKIIRIEN
jgi:hypothetical protein